MFDPRILTNEGLRRHIESLQEQMAAALKDVERRKAEEQKKDPDGYKKFNRFAWMDDRITRSAAGYPFHR